MFDDIGRKDVAAEEEVVVLLEALSASSGIPELMELGQLFGLKIVDILVQRFARIDLVDDAVDPREHQRGESQVRIACCIGAAEFQPFRLRVG